ncbi:Scarecrow-like protein [Actinidia chinensis var. chinensis]|uniref:Scarecrow-like protein n=1 Tax=Actinidia chinensis var. chinensis TaxID=1590841 RepID=A0A2R6QJ29_ACTCC|nr:Scarecrow-like protein [Actinidia chinensis var. chinensis]
MIMEALVQKFSTSLLDLNHHTYLDLPFLSDGRNTTHVSPSPSYASEEGDATLKLISQMLMEEDDLENKPCMFQECLALQATEKSFYDVLGEKYPPSIDQNSCLSNLDRSYDDESYRTTWSSGSSNSPASVNNFSDQSNWVRDRQKLGRSAFDEYTFESILESIVPSNGSKVVDLIPITSNLSYGSETKEGISKVVAEADKKKRDNSPNRSREKKTHIREDGDYVDTGRINKQLASFTDESDEQLDLFDKVLLCPWLNPHLHDDQDRSICLYHHEGSQNGTSEKLKVQQNGSGKGSNGGKARGKKQSNKKEVVDLRAILSQCAQAVASADIRTANELLSRIRQHSSPEGDGTERLAHYFANGLEARLAGTGTALYTAFRAKRISAADILKGYQVYVKACPFNKMSNLYANRSIGKLAKKATTKLHIIDFGILYGFQWPCLIQHLSLRAGGPPKIRITGIEFPQPGFRPAQRVEETGRRLRTYCDRFGVPFEYTAIAKKWETIDLEDLKIDRDEVLVVNCLFRLRNVLDETVIVNSPRDKVLNLVKRINPDLFIHGVHNGTYNAPFFVTRFREALFHYSAGFDMFEATVQQGDPNRMMFEKEVMGRDIMNVIACEGTERVERPETYKQWQVRNVRAGFRQLPLDREILGDVKTMVKRGYNKDFVVDEDGNWMLQGWKGRITHALSCWKPKKESQM